MKRGLKKRVTPIETPVIGRHDTFNAERRSAGQEESS